MSDISSTARDAETRAKAQLRRLHGHDIGDDLAAVGDEIRDKADDAADRAREGVDDLRDAARHEQRHERVVRERR